MIARLLAGVLVVVPALAAAQSLPESFERCRNAEDPASGIEACKKTLENQTILQAERARTYVTLATYQRDAGDYAAALDSLDRAAEIAPNAPTIPAERAIVLHLGGDLAGAMKAHARAFALGGDSPAALNNRAVTELALGNAGAAIADFDAALQIMADYGVILDNRATAKCLACDVDGSVADRLAAIEMGGPDLEALEGAVSAGGAAAEFGSGAGESAGAVEQWTAAGCPGAPAPAFL
jgi:Flp pilus assembly protein TadD